MYPSINSLYKLALKLVHAQVAGAHVRYSYCTSYSY